MRLVVLGNSGSYPGPGSACSGYLVCDGDTTLLLDCGPGVVANLQTVVSVNDLSGVFITHMHADHFLDLVSLRYACVYGKDPRRELLPVFLPPEGQCIWEQVTSAFDETRGSFSAPFDLSEYQEDTHYRTGSFTVRPMQLDHFVPDYGMRVEGDGVLAYTGDTAPCVAAANLAREADLFLCEASYAERDPSTGKRGHLTAAEAGALAREADVRSLLLTHFHPDTDRSLILDRAREASDLAVALSELHASYEIGTES